MIILYNMDYYIQAGTNGRQLADGIFKYVFLNGILNILVKISMKYALENQINKPPALVQKMVWCRSGDKPLSKQTVT